MVQWGDVGTWVAGLATAGGFVVTALVFSMQLRDRRRRDARQVSAWVDRRSYEVNPPQYSVKYRNVSPEPIYLLVVKVGNRREAKSTVVSVVGPSKTQEMTVKIEGKVDPRTGETIRWDPPIHIRFTDAAGRRWGREANGKLLKSHWWRRLDEAEGLQALIESGQPAAG
jgi:hypothetical protein